MLDFEQHIHTAGAYVFYDGYFVFMFGFGTNHTKNELGVVRFGGHREQGENALECVAREVKEESSLDITFYENKHIYVEKDNHGSYEKIAGAQRNNPILVFGGKEKRLSLMYLVHGRGTLAPKMETQGILFLRRDDIKIICSKDITFRKYKENGGKYLQVRELPENAVLLPHTQIRFLNDLFLFGKGFNGKVYGSL